MIPGLGIVQSQLFSHKESESWLLFLASDTMRLRDERRLRVDKMHPSRAV